MNNEKKKNGSVSVRVTATDVFIIIAAAILLLLIVRFVFLTDANDEAYDISYVIKLSGVRDEFSDKLKAGDALYLVSNGVKVGTVTACESTASVLDKTGQVVPGKSDIYVTVEVKSSEADRINVSGCDILVEGQYAMRSANFSFECVCVSIGK